MVNRAYVSGPTRRKITTYGWSISGQGSLGRVPQVFEVGLNPPVPEPDSSAVPASATPLQR